MEAPFLFDSPFAQVLPRQGQSGLSGSAESKTCPGQCFYL